MYVAISDDNLIIRMLYYCCSIVGTIFLIQPCTAIVSQKRKKPGRPSQAMA